MFFDPSPVGVTYAEIAERASQLPEPLKLGGSRLVVHIQTSPEAVEDFLTTTLGLLKSLITAAVFQVWLKWLIGGLRPHFFAVCQPNIDPPAMPNGTGFMNIMYDRTG